MASKKGITGLFLLSHTVLLLMMLFTFPRINAKFGTQAFDLKTFGYSQSEATMMLRNLDQSTIDLYLLPQLFLLDILYPILLALFLSTLIIRLSNLIKINENHVFSNLFMLPFIAMFIDYFENIMITLMITNPTNVVRSDKNSKHLYTDERSVHHFELAGYFNPLVRLAD
ncbi:MAG: hypothetical protein HQ522_11785 [Bacteroidetes bacterium]|nr:hypothetical protein [Bacteroidota bacterium]